MSKLRDEVYTQMRRFYFQGKTKFINEHPTLKNADQIYIENMIIEMLVDVYFATEMLVQLVEESDTHDE